MIDPRLAEILVCPADHGELEQQVSRSRLVCTVCGRQYPVEDGVPIMTVEPAEEDDE